MADVRTRSTRCQLEESSRETDDPAKVREGSRGEKWKGEGDDRLVGR